MKKILIFILTLSLLSLVGCGKEATESKKTEKESVILKIAVPAASPALPILRMMEKNDFGENVIIDFKVWTTMDEMLAIVSKKEADLIAMPVNVAPKLYNKGIDISLLNVNTWGILYFLSSDESIKNWNDLKGKEIYIPAQSSSTDILTQHFLNKSGINPQNDLNIKYSSTPEIAQMFKNDMIKYALLPEPMATSVLADGKAKIVFDYVKEWKKIEGEDTNLPQTGFFVVNSFAKSNKNLVDLFQIEYEKALKWTNENPAEAGILAEKHLNLKSKLIQKAMPRLGLDFKNAQDSKDDVKLYLETINKSTPESIGGKLPDENFYYKK